MARRAHGEGSVYRRADGMWVASISLPTDHTGKRRRWTGKSKTHAGVLAKLNKAKSELQRYGDLTTSSPTVEEWMTKWLDLYVKPIRKPRTYIDYEQLYRDYIKPAIGKVRLSTLTIEHVNQACAGPLQAGQLKTVQKIRGVLSAALSQAMRSNLVARNVAQLAVLPSPPKRDQASLTTAQARQLVVSAVGTPLQSRWMLALLSGARQGECLGLTLDRLDLDNAVADISWQLQRLPYIHGCNNTCGQPSPGKCPKRAIHTPVTHESVILDGSLALTRPKTGGSIRLVPLSPTFVVAAREHLAATVGEPNPHNLVWRRPDGRPIDPKDDRDAWRTGLTNAGLAHVKLHGARNTTATLLLEMGVDAKVIQQLLGHTTVVTTRGYQSVSLEMARGAVAALGNALG